MDMWAPSRSAGIGEELAQAPAPVGEDRGELSPDPERVEQEAQGTQREAVGDPVLNPRAPLLRAEEVPVLPARVGTADLDIHEAIRRIVLADQSPPPERDSQPADAEGEDGPRRQGETR